MVSSVSGSTGATGSVCPRRRSHHVAAIPTLRVVPNPRVAQFARVESMGWVVPVGDTSLRLYVGGRAREKGDIGRAEELLDECPEHLRGWEWYYLKRRRYVEPLKLSHGE